MGRAISACLYMHTRVCICGYVNAPIGFRLYPPKQTVHRSIIWVVLEIRVPFCILFTRVLYNFGDLLQKGRSFRELPIWGLAFSMLYFSDLEPKTRNPTITLKYDS